MEDIIGRRNQIEAFTSLLNGCYYGTPRFTGFLNWQLATRDAHGLYAKFGFKPLDIPELVVRKNVPVVYKKYNQATFSTNTAVQLGSASVISHLTS
jgi:hypothetical protein